MHLRDSAIGVRREVQMGARQTGFENLPPFGQEDPPCHLLKGRSHEILLEGRE